MIKINNSIIEYESEIRKRCLNQGIDISDKYIMFQIWGTYFNGENVDGYTESKDGRFVCIPVYDDEGSNLTGGYEYKPQCFEIANKMTTYLSNGSMATLSTIWLLYKE